MKFLDVAKAYGAIGGLSNWKLPPTTAYEIFKLKNELRRVCAFIEEEERKAVDEMGGTVSGDNRVNFGSPDDYQRYCERVQKIYSEDVPDVSIVPIKININTCGDDTLSVAAIEALDGFVEFFNPTESEER